MKEFSNRPPRAGKPRFSRGPRDAAPRAPKRPTLDITLAQAFTDMGLATELVQAVADLGFTEPTKVQMAAIPRSLNRSEGEVVDLLVSSQTGSGKTAAFLLPVLHIILEQQHAERIAQEREATEARAAREAALAAEGQDADAVDSAEKLLADNKPKADKRPARSFEPATPGALILCPTRELAQQVAADAIDLVAHCRGLRVASVVGGTSYVHQLAGLRNANVVVATPGRLLDLQKSGQIRLDKVQYLVVDEADRMLDLGFAEDLAEVHALTKDRAQTMMFSATFAPRVQQLAMRVMRKTERIELATPESTHDNIEQRCTGRTTPSISASCWITSCVTPRSSKRLFSQAPRLNAIHWPKICNKMAFQPSLCMVHWGRACVIAVWRHCAMARYKFWSPLTWLPVASTYPPSPTCSTLACR